MSAISLRDLVEQGRQNSQAPALAAALFTGDKVLDQHIAGQRRQDRDEPVAETDLFHLGSNLKAVVATAAVRLAQEGRLSLEQPLGDLFTDGTLHPDYAAVTFAQLLRHRAGLQPFTSSHEEMFDELSDLTVPPVEARHELTRRLLTRPPAFTPGSDMHYSNAGYAVAASLLETLTGRPWEALVEDYVLAPLGIRGFFGLPPEAGDEQPWGHDDDSGTLAPVESLEPYQLPAFLTPAGNLSLSLPDYVTFLQLHLTALKGESPLLSREAARLLHGLDGDPPMGWGGARNARGVRLSQHFGTSGAFFAGAVLYPERDTGFTVLTNAFSDAVEKAAISVARAALTSTLDS